MYFMDVTLYVLSYRFLSYFKFELFHRIMMHQNYQVGMKVLPDFIMHIANEDAKAYRNIKSST